MSGGPGPFGKPIFGNPPPPPVGNGSGNISANPSAPNAGVARYNFNFRQSALSSVADNMWSKSKTTFETDKKSTPVHLEKKSLNEALGKIVAGSKDATEPEAPTTFVFGSQIKDKVVGDPLPSISSENEDKNVESPLKEKTTPSKSSLSGDGAADSNKFREESTQAAENLKKEQEKNLASTSIVAVTTGEENDKNLFQTACKLHSFDKERKKWIERGLCHVRINERVENAQTHYRIVVRSTGNQRVLINSKIFADMFLERADAKRTKISAMGPDASTPQIFLLTISFSKTDICSDQLFKTLNECLDKEKSIENSNRKRKAEDQPEPEFVEVASAKKERAADDESAGNSASSGCPTPTTEAQHSVPENAEKSSELSSADDNDSKDEQQTKDEPTDNSQLKQNETTEAEA